MSNKILFIGGSADGRRIEVPDSERYYLVPVPGGGTDEYRRAWLSASSWKQYAAFVFTGLTASDALDRLINFYVAPDKPARKEDRLEEQILRLLAQPHRVWEPELLFQQFADHERQAAAVKLWDLLAEKKVELTWDRRLKLNKP